MHNSLILLARPAGLEPATHGLEGRCSIQLSHERMIGNVKKQEEVIYTCHREKSNQPA